MRRNALLWGLVAAALIVVAYAWFDGGLRPIEEITQPVAIPETVK